MTKPVRHTKHEIEYAAKCAAEHNVKIVLKPDGSMEVFPIHHRTGKNSLVEIETNSENDAALDRFRARRDESKIVRYPQGR